MTEFTRGKALAFDYYGTSADKQALAAEIDTTPARYALAWTLAQPAMSSLVVGAKRSEQVADAVAAADLEIRCEHFARSDEIVPAPGKQDDPIR